MTKINAMVGSISLALLGAAPFAHAAGPGNVNACGTLAAPGSYVLTRNVAATGDCFNITADDVTLDFDGFTASGSGTGSAINIAGRGVTVKNGTVRGFGVGISITHLAGTPSARVAATVERMKVLDMVGFAIGGFDGIVRDSVIVGNGNTGIGLGGGPSLIVDNRILGNRAGIAAGPGSVVTGNVVSGNQLSGIVVTCPAVVVNNTSVGHTLNLGMTGPGCEVAHNAIGPDIFPPPGP